MNCDQLYIITTFLVSFAAGAICIPLVVQMCKKYNLYDQPNARKVHKVAIPRLGGIVFMPSMLFGITAGFTVLHNYNGKTFVLTVSMVAMIFGAFLIYLIGLLDDFKGMKAAHKFVIQLVASSVFPLCNLMINDLHGFCGINEIPIYVSYPLTVLVIMVIVNAMNLIDGIDGLSSSLSILILLAFAHLYYQLGAPIFVLLAIGLVGPVVAFFIYNFFGKVGRNKVFMGDTGSLFLGYVIAYLAIKYQMYNDLVFPYREESLLVSETLVFIPVIDVARVAIFRKLRGNGIFEPDKTHIHHIIMQAGASMHQTLAIILLMFGVFCVVNYGLFIFDLNITFIILIDVAIYGLFMWIMSKLGEE